MCRVEVSDTGAGMDGKTWATLFDERKKRKEKGMGVGLLNARLIIKTYGGHVHKVANSYRGVTVGFSLPIAPPEGSEVHLTSVTEDVSFNVDSSMEAS
jgi:K+-sensing histidine kinase KdpD